MLSEQVYGEPSHQGCVCDPPPVGVNIRKPPPYLARKRKGPARGPFFRGEGGIHAPPAASRAHMRLRRCVSRPASEVRNHTRRENETAPRGGAFHFLAERVGFEPTKGY